MTLGPAVSLDTVSRFGRELACETGVIYEGLSSRVSAAGGNIGQVIFGHGGGELHVVVRQRRHHGEPCDAGTVQLQFWQISEIMGPALMLVVWVRRIRPVNGCGFEAGILRAWGEFYIVAFAEYARRGHPEVKPLPAAWLGALITRVLVDAAAPFPLPNYEVFQWGGLSPIDAAVLPDERDLVFNLERGGNRFGLRFCTGVCHHKCMVAHFTIF